jgi:exonuclease III
MVRRNLEAMARRMYIATWNCNGALRNKLDALATLKFDIAVIQECEDPERSTSASYKSWAKNYLWTGKNKNKGLGVFAAPEVRLAPVNLDLGQLESFLPCRINDSFLLVAA